MSPQNAAKLTIYFLFATVKHTACVDVETVSQNDRRYLRILAPAISSEANANSFTWKHGVALRICLAPLRCSATFGSVGCFCIGAVPLGGTKSRGRLFDNPLVKSHGRLGQFKLEQLNNQ